MSEPAAAAMARLRVHVAANDPHRRATLEAVVLAAGHALASADAADVVLSDGDIGAATHAPIVALGAADDQHAGALPRTAGAAQIDAALRAAAVGLIVRAGEFEAAFDELPEPTHPLLTPRETEVLVAISDGLSNKEIARRLEISLHTVKFHIEQLLRKLGARSRAEAVAKGLIRREI
jgi:DNA-binding CsgD family transcriptional regulator